MKYTESMTDADKVFDKLSKRSINVNQNFNSLLRELHVSSNIKDGMIYFNRATTLTNDVQSTPVTFEQHEEIPLANLLEIVDILLNGSKHATP